MSDTVLDIVTDILTEIEAYQVGEDVDPADAQRVVRIVNRELDAWAARKLYVYAVTFTEFTLTPDHAPHLIGPGLNPPDFAVAQRPVRLEGATLVLNNVTPNVDIPLNPRGSDWWNYQRVKSLTTAVPTDLYYNPAYPNGELNFWPVPDFGYGARLELWGLLAQLGKLSLAFDMPPGYKRAVVLTGAVRSCRPFGRPLRPDLVADAAQARADIQKDNAKVQPMPSADFGASGSSGRRRGDFNYYTGGPA